MKIERKTEKLTLITMCKARRMHNKIIIGIINLIMIKVAIKNGENVSTRNLTQLGSNELKLAMFPVENIPIIT